MLKTGSVPSEVVIEALTGDIIPVLNDKILFEYEDVLRRPKFKFNPDDVDTILSALKHRGIYVQEATVEELLPDPKDIVFYAVLMEAREDTEAYLVTGNLKHFPVGTYIVTPREMMDIVTSNRE